MGHSADGALEKGVAGLSRIAISHPGISWYDPSDIFWPNAHLQQPGADIHRCFAAAQDNVALVPACGNRQQVGRYEFDAFGDSKGGGVRRGHLGVHERSVHESLAKRDLPDCARDERNEPSVSEMVTHRKILDATRRQKTFLHQPVEIADDLRARGQFIVTPIEAGYVDAVTAELTRSHAIERRWLMQPDKRIGVVPLAPRHVMQDDKNHGYIGDGYQLIFEAHAIGSAADDQILGRQHCYSPGTYPPVIAAIWLLVSAIRSPARPRASPSLVLPTAAEIMS